MPNERMLVRPPLLRISLSVNAFCLVKEHSVGISDVRCVSSYCLECVASILLSVLELSVSFGQARWRSELTKIMMSVCKLKSNHTNENTEHLLEVLYSPGWSKHDLNLFGVYIRRARKDSSGSY